VLLRAGQHDMLPIKAGKFLSLLSDTVKWASRLKQAAAACNYHQAFVALHRIQADMQKLTLTAASAVL